jgi:hypothetical protein
VSTWVIVALSVLAVWLGVLTLVMLLVIRQVGMLTVQLAVPRVSLDSDGLEVGSPLPEAVVAKIPQIATARAYLIHISATCTPCRTLVEDLSARPLSSDAPLVVLLSGAAELADGLAAQLPADIRVIRDPDATEITHALQLRSTPFIIAVEERKVHEKAYLHSAQHLAELVTTQTAVPLTAVS